MVSNKMLRTLALCLSFSIAGAASAQDRPLPHTDNIDATLLSEIKKQEIVGLAVIVIDRGEVAWSRAYGYADREQRIAVDLNTTQFRWASVSKPLTAIAAMQLAEKGQLDLDADIRTYVPEFPDKGVKITARQLLCHRGGIVHNNNLESKIKYAAPHPFEDVIVALDQFKEAPLVHSPGQQFEYSTQGYMLLSAVIERAGKQRFADQIQDRIAKPLGMKTLRPDFPWEDIPGRAAGYRRTDKGVERRPENEVTEAYWKWGGGGFSSTPSDLAAFCVGLLQTKLVSKQTQEQMWSPVTPTDKPQFNYGFGFYVVKSPTGSLWVGHDGSQTKARTGLLMEPDQRRGIVIMTNCEWVDPMPIAMNLLEMMK
jgi:CubicO group peptidase (beta-lactamase class C family)